MIIVSKDQFDKLIEEVIAEEIDEIKVPDGQYIWDNIKKNLDVSGENKIKKYNYKKVSGLIIAFVTISALLIWSPTELNASYIRILKRISEITGGKIEINIDSVNNTRDNSWVSIDNNGVPTTISLDIDEAKKKSSFQLVLPSYLPADFELKEVELEQLGNKTLSAKISYSNNDKTLIELVEIPVKREYTKNIGVNQEKAKVETVSNNGFEYTVILYNNNRVTVLWNIYDMEYSLRGSDKEEMLKIAFSLK